MAKLNPRTTISRPKPKKPVKPVPKVARKVVVADKAKRKLPPPPVVKVKEKEPEKGKEKPRLAKAPVAPNGRPAAEASTPDAQSVIASIGTIKSQSGIDLTEKIKELVRLAQEQGYLTYNDINDALPDTMISPEELDEIYIKLRNLEVEIVRQLNEAIREISLRDAGRVVLDFAKVDQLDCSGIGQLVQAYDQVRAAGRALVLVNVERRLKRLLQMAGLLAIFVVLDSRQKAMPGREPEALQVCDRTSRPLERAERESIARAVAPSPTPAS